ncbi:MAG: translocation/assembly module TamB domain-containing protein [Saprospirales bacterium]|nr:translocation/assembly module TamB domain-containing protein [Saprospirales bacterium]
MHVVAQADSLILNTIDYGALRIDVEAENLRSAFNANATITKGPQKIAASGFYNPPNFQPDNANRSHPATQNYMDAKADLSNFPLAFLEIWIGDGVSDTEGLVTGNVMVKGPPEKPELLGKAMVRNGATTIDFLNTRYFIDKQTVELTSTMIDATGATITDQLGNKATVYGGITHDHMKNMGLNAQIRSDNFLMLNTKKGQNELFYGTAIASGNLLFTGPFPKADIYVNATSKAGTHIVLPISSSRSASEVNFIHFTQRYRKPDPDAMVPKAQEELGLSVDMDLNITDDAIIEMVFNEQAGDILRGRGNGTIKMTVPRNGDFLMFGDYAVTSGDYLFTLMNLVNKPFVVRRGGTIRWSGDPFKAEINIAAEYKDLKASLTNFLAEYLVNETGSIKDAARLPADVDLVMNLSGELLLPTVDFDIQFPRVPNELKNYTDSKLRILRQDQNEMNRQVFGLVILGQFLPAQNALQGQELAIGINTLTEMLSQQFSNYLTGLVSEWRSEEGLISGIDFDIAYNYIQGTDVNDPDQLYRSNEVQVRLKNYLFDDRLAVNVGGNFDLTGGSSFPGAATSSGILFAGDLAVEYLLTKDQTLKIRFYQSTEPAIEGGRQNKTGLGLSYRKEFDTFDEFIKGLKGVTKKMGGS